MRDYLNDIRLYVDPRGKIEHDIVDSIEKSIRRDILRLIGLDPHFRLLDPEAQMTALGKRRRFDRVIWVAHSLGSVISYNVVTELVSEAIRLEKEGDLDQQRGVGRFRECLARFVTLGSPLDKIAFLFKDRLRNWPNVTRNEFFKTNVDDISVRFLGAEKEWWINFYHVLDPVSGSLDNPDICGNKPPANFHARSCLIPGLAHVAYWKDLATLRFILSRAYSWRRLRDKPLVQWPTTVLTLLAAGSYVVWAAVMLIALAVMVVWGWELVQTTWEKVVEIGASWGIPIS